jgi:hypothetical protein
MKLTDYRTLFGVCFLAVLITGAYIYVQPTEYFGAVCDALKYLGGFLAAKSIHQHHINKK